MLKITTNWFNHSFWSSPPSAIWRKRVDKNVSCLGHSLLRYDRPYSKSSLTLNEWKLNLSFSRLSLLFSSSWRASVIPYYVTTHPPAIQKQHWHSREAQIELPLIECEWAFRIRADVLESWEISKPHNWRHLFDVELYLTVHKSFVSTSLNIIHCGCTFHLSYPYWTLYENTMNSIIPTVHKLT